MSFSWPIGFARIPDDEWTRQPLESLALKYDTVENHGWYDNLDRTVAQVGASLRPGDILIDYSGGTGIFAGRLLKAFPDLRAGIIIIDSSAKFLRLALAKFQEDERVAFRLIRYLKDAKRLEYVDEVLPPGMARGGASAVVSTNAIHLYYDLPHTLASWARVVRPGGGVFVQSGNIRNPAAPRGEWIIDETVEAIHRAALTIVRADGRFAAYRESALDPDRLAPYDELRQKYFLPVRPLEDYVRALETAGIRVRSTTNATIPAPVDEWYDFLSVYHEGVLGWVGGVEKVTGRPTPPDAVRDRLELMRAAMDHVFEHRPAFNCTWTYITGETKRD